ncbi:hypothetical protein TraAM80_08946 [Trypanosoma rangeli]|uniref:Uncharacterized protein n=1 Tax=Trypanosoma rangeli TaxID=5698 RepID=A0A3R7M8Y7_TRYRA|nr:uncharacterized protein TraAM80_08946 [Trypanosoma rangeli]RNE98301.1 hypothetical protein TraAM80_08946 [Trypanosoma rangeli]|eukprot:RNE98301.1 hypothetical protein TraAM80_08946 [Trypanosoma rangeli]
MFSMRFRAWRQAWAQLPPHGPRRAASPQGATWRAGTHSLGQICVVVFFFFLGVEGYDALRRLPCVAEAYASRSTAAAPPAVGRGPFSQLHVAATGLFDDVGWRTGQRINLQASRKRGHAEVFLEVGCEGEKPAGEGHTVRGNPSLPGWDAGGQWKVISQGGGKTGN